MTADIDARQRLLELHGIVYRDVMWLAADGAEETAELPVCGHCVPRHSSFPSRAEVPEGPCLTLRLLALAFRLPQ
ncbi:hypothetical protein [Streptomyces smyrnaeus]|uniref:hypothetical protein n=1 Tax=Streptomyces smyrnaeus TaxID=1387713 RepID=UPI003401973B